MKRGLCALIIFCLCIAFSVFFDIKNKSALESARVRVNEIRLLCEDGKTEDALKKADEFTKNWERDRLTIKITLEQSEVKQIETAVTSVARLIKCGKTDNAVDICEDTVCEIDYLLEKEKLSFENIF